MRTPFIAAGAMAAALALNPTAAFGDEHLNTSRTDLRQDVSQGIVGRLVSLQDYLAKGDQAVSTSTNTTSHRATPSDVDTKRQSSSSGTLDAPGRDRINASSTNPRYDADSQGSRLASAPEPGFSRMNRESSQAQTLVLIVQNGSSPGAQTASPRPASGQIAGAQSRSNSPSWTGSTAPNATGQAYILLFDENPASQSAFLRAKRILADGSSTWATSAAEAGDRLPVRGTDDADTAARRDGTVKQPQGETAGTEEKGGREPAGKWSKDNSDVRVTGKLVSRGGIPAIQVSEIASAKMPNDASLRNSGTEDRDPSKPKDDKK